MKIRFLNTALFQYKYPSLVLLLVALLLSSCITDDSFSDSSSDTTNVKLTFFISDGANTRAINTTNENVVSDITVLVFDKSGSLIGSKYESSVSATSVDVPTHSASGATIYAIANTGSPSYFAGVNTIEQLKNMSTTIASASALESAGSTSGSTGALLVGKSSVDILAGVANKFSITLKHQCSKFSFTITPASGVTITGYQLCNVPLSSYITDSLSAVGPPGGISSYGNFPAVSGLSQTAALSKTYYVYENLCGSNSNATTEAKRNSSNAPTTASYLLINAKGSSWKSTYRVYLGGVSNTAAPATDLTNFNIYRNLNYNCTITLGASGGSGDARVTYTATGQGKRSDAVTGTATVGNYLFSDGTTGTTKGSKTVVGIVFSNMVSPAEYNAGYTHGYALALTDASSGGASWGPSTDAGLTKVTTFAGSYNDITAGYYGTFIKGYNKNNNSYPAWASANNYNVNVSGFKNSGWYLPSTGQLWDVAANLGKIDLTSMQTSTSSVGTLYTSNIITTVNAAITAAGGTPLKSLYWSASEYDASSGGTFYFDSSNSVLIGGNAKWATIPIRSVLAF